jgi:hypothetical protein
MLDTDPDRSRIQAAAVGGTLPTMAIDEVRCRRKSVAQWAMKRGRPLASPPVRDRG